MLGGRSKKRQRNGFNAKSPQPKPSLVDNRIQGRGRQAQSHFSLQDEARNTERNGKWVAEQKLRHSKVNFISAGNLYGEDVTEKESAHEAASTRTVQNLSAGDRSQLELSMTRLTLRATTDDPSSMASDASYDGVSQYVEGHNNAEETNGTVKASGRDEGQAFILDDRKNESVQMTGFSNPDVRARSASIASSASSEDIVVFKGRKNLRTKPPLKKPPQQKVTILEDPIFASKSLSPVKRFIMPTTRSSPATSTVHSSVMNEKPVLIARQKSEDSTAHEPDDSVMNDYLANVDHFDPLATLTAELASDLQRKQEPLISLANDRTRSRERGHQASERDWNSSDLEDFNDHSTSDAASPEVRKIIAKREKSSGIQYLVVFAGFSSDDARWIPIERLGTPTARERIRAFEDNHAEKFAAPDGSYDSDQSTDAGDLADSDLQRDMDDMLNEEKLIERRREKMTDEQIARILAKQEELGLGSEEVLLFDGIDGSNFEENCLGIRASASTRRKRKVKSGKPKHKTNSHAGVFTNSNLYKDIQGTDPYNGFDIMDFERPSLQRKRKGRQTALDFDFSDSDLAMEMAATWNNDRTKKKLRKVERQLQKERSQGTNRSGSPACMEITDMKRQILMFLGSGRSSISFPPMNKSDRRAIHELANRLNLTSKSQGSGHKRFPVLYRTKRTPDVTEDEFNQIVEQLSRRFKNLRSGKMSRRAATFPQGRGGYSHAAVSCRDGEVVGAGAAELGHENRGRAMLEKMGWSAGTAIGALNNKGIMQPVAHIVKTTKAGLG